MTLVCADDASQMVEALYEGPAHDAAFYLPSAGIVQFRFSDTRSGGYLRARDGSLTPARPGARVFLSAGQHILILYDPNLIARVSIKFWPH